MCDKQNIIEYTFSLILELIPPITSEYDMQQDQKINNSKNKEQ